MTKPSDVWMPLYVTDYQRDTARLTVEEHGAYLLLIMDYWLNGPPPDDDRALMTLTKMTRQRWRHARKILAPFFCTHDGVWRHKRIDLELDRAHKIIEQRQAAGRASAEARASKGINENSTDVPTSVQTDVVENSNARSTSVPTPVPTPVAAPLPHLRPRHQSKGSSGESEATLRKPTNLNIKSTSLTENITPRARARGRDTAQPAESEEGKAVKFNLKSVPIGRSAPSAPDGALATADEKRELLRVKLFRFCLATFAEPQLSVTVAGLSGADPKHNERWWMNRVDKLRKIQRWDDAKPSRRDATATLGQDPGPNDDAEDYAFRQAAAALR
jgi:uncharacterized protein YdaU (DUF1376 family)